MSLLPGDRLFSILIRATATGAPDTDFAVFASSSVPTSSALPNGQTLGSGQRAICLYSGATQTEDAVYVTFDGGSNWSKLLVLSDLGLLPTSDVTISAGGAAALTAAVHTIRGAGGVADNCDTISGMTDAEIALLVTGAEAITYRDASVGGGNIATQRDASIITATGDMVMAVLSGSTVYIVPLMVQAGVPTSSSGTGATGADGTGATGSASIRTAPYNSFTAPAAASANGVHAAYGDDQPVNFPGPISNPAIPRNVTLTTAGAGWTGGDVTVTGTDQFDAPVSETLTPNAGGGLTTGTKIFKTITAIAKALVGVAATTCSVGWGNKLGLTYLPSAALGALTCDGVNENGTWDATYGGVTPTTAPNAGHNYAAMYPYGDSHTHTGPSHTHTGPSHTHQS